MCMKEITKIVYVDKELAQNIQEHLDHNSSITGIENFRGNRERKFYKSFNPIINDGFEVDINIYDRSNGPFIDAILFYKGNEVEHLDAIWTLLGEYKFFYSETKIIVKLTIKNT